MSKGSKPRPVNKPKFDKNYNDIDWTKMKLDAEENLIVNENQTGKNKTNKIKK